MFIGYWTLGACSQETKSRYALDRKVVPPRFWLQNINFLCSQRAQRKQGVNFYTYVENLTFWAQKCNNT